jgi:hypothetical protein
MKAILTSSFFWRFAGGFALGGVGVLTMHPAGAHTVPQAPVSATIHAAN